LFKSEERKTRAEVSDFLAELSGKLSEGQVVLRRGGEELVIDLPGNLILEVQVEDEEKSRGVQHSLEVEIKWYDEGVGAGPLELG
jgi:amphi-Trp domain-containing protein